MPSIYGNVPSSSGGGGSQHITYGGGGGGYGSIPAAEKSAPTAGKTAVDLTDPVDSIGGALESLGEFAAPIGGIAGAIGSIGFGDGKNLGAIADAPGNALGAIGNVTLPYLGNDPTKRAATLGDVPGKIGEVISLPGKALERTIAGQRVTGGPLADFDVQDVLPFGGLNRGLRTAAGQGREPLPPDLQDRLDAGESPDVIADELVARGAGYSSDPIKNLAGELVLDPTNLIGGAVGKIGGALERAGAAVRATEDLSKIGLGERVAGATFNAASRGLTTAGAGIMDKLIGPTTSGAFHALGTKPYNTLVNAFGRLDRGYATALEDAGAVANAQLPRAVLANRMADEVSAGFRRVEDGIDDVIDSKLTAVRAYKPQELERQTQELLERTLPDFVGHTPEQLADETARRLSIITGASPEDAARIVGRKVSPDMARTVHWLFYGKAGDDLAAAKAAAAGAKNIDAGRLTLLSNDTLTVDKAKALLDEVDIHEALDKFSILSNRFAGKVVSDGEVKAFVKKLIDQEALPQAVKAATSKRNKLPSALSEWRSKYMDLGYDIGFEPKDGWHVVTDDLGKVETADPFASFVSARDPLTQRNPVGKLMDSMFRGISQGTIIQQSRKRMGDLVARLDLPVSPNQTRAIHKAILDEAAERGVTPRALAGEKVSSGTGEARLSEPLYNAIFRRFLSADEYRAVVEKADPTYLVMKAFQGNWKTVGLTQKLTGEAKVLSKTVASVAEDIYPNVRFSKNPLFQAQEQIESPFWNLMRGVSKRTVDPEVADAYKQMSDLPEFRYLTEAGYFLNIASGRSVAKYMGVNTGVGRALGRFGNVAGRKEIARVSQVLAEHGEEFRGAVNSINPKFWKTMEEAYGTSDARTIADRFLRERMLLASDPDAAVKLMDSVKPSLEGAAGETVWEAFRESLRTTSQEAFKTHYFSPRRGWLERTINHPYLGLYPASYMWGKVLPEFARFLIARPFGVKAPLVGLNAVNRVQQAYVGALADNPDFRKFMEDNKDAVYLANLLLPGTPSNMPVNAPAWARHISEDLSAGRDVNAQTVLREAQDTTAYAFGPLNSVVTAGKAGADLASIGQDVFANLTKSAQEYDGQFPPRSQPTFGTPLAP